jgi:hypothetical protein
MKRTYIISEDEYMGGGLQMREFIGTWRELLQHLTGVDSDDPEDELRNATNNTMIDVFNDANGDGQPYVMVWCVEKHAQVLGGTK